ncbi:RWD domain-containing protein 1 [Orchesella cincta]|uniref:RWD domain-containing protein 1 n=1 Tax=Orchesella cincta TaxID=48709 RepID=A0A1D2NES7_ORCCI|nr:RWD domain-containing protein 1 [Orchesella cincta]
MDYAEEQQSELEALEAIYPSEYTILSDDPVSFTIITRTAEFEDTGDGYTALLKFTFTPKYPEEIPEIEVVPSEEDDQTNLEPEECEDLVRVLAEQAEENTGMAMVFTLVSAALEWLNERWDASIQEKEAAEEKKRMQEEEEEHKRFEGTRVTIQTFIEWKTKFDAEMAILRRKDFDIKEKETTNKKLTGRELFMCDKTLNDSDLTFDEGDDAVPIDESLFEDMEDLDIGEDDGEDED